jgi:protein-S-isoprenylcysteine O-methyltransferase Ste14
MDIIVKGIVFSLFTLLLGYLSRKSFRFPPSHGFFRFFCWEGILLLILINFETWFKYPFSLHQILSWILLLISLVPLILGAKQLCSQGSQSDIRDAEHALFGFEKTTQLVTTGIYRYIRHPLYSSLLLLTLGVFCKSLTLTNFCLAIVSITFIIAAARVDETECLKYFGLSYKKYMENTRRFFPFLY